MNCKAANDHLIPGNAQLAPLTDVWRIRGRALMLLEQLSSLPSMAPRSNPMLRPPRSLLGQNNPQLRTHIKPKGDFCFEVSRIHSDLNGYNLTSQFLEIRLSLIRWPLAPIASRQIGGEVDSLKFGLLLLLLLLHVLASFAAGLKVHSWLGFKSSKSHICRFRSKSLACKLSPRGSFIFMQCNALQCFNNVSQ